MLVLKSTHDKVVERVNNLETANWIKIFTANYIIKLEKISSGNDLMIVEDRFLDNITYFLRYSKYNPLEKYLYSTYVKMSSKEEAEKWLNKIKNDEAVNKFILKVKEKKMECLKKLGDSNSVWSQDTKEDYTVLFKEYNKAIENVLGND